MKKEETTKEFHPRASTEPTQATVPAHHRLYRTRLWQIVHAGVGIGCTCESCRDAEDESFTAPLVAHGAKAKIVDFANALLRLEGLTTCDGTKLSFADVVRALGIAFNVDTPSLYIQRYQNRNRYKGATQFMRCLAALLEKDSDEML